MARTPRCRAKNPSLCVDPACPERRGGSQAVVLPKPPVVQTPAQSTRKTKRTLDDYRRSREARQLIREANKLPQAQPVAMKDLDTKGLARAIIQVAGKDLSRADQISLARSIQWAEELHRGTERKNPVHKSDGTYQDSSPYIMHPLRNTLRLALMGVRDVDVLIASVLHDTVEDEASKMSGLEKKAPEELHREGALKAVRSAHNQRTGDLVESVSNPILAEDLTKAEKNEFYAGHVEEGVMSNVGTFLIKATDFIDNGLSLHHNSSGAHINKSRAVKYLLVVPVFQRAFKHHEKALRGMLTEEGFNRLKARLDGADAYLRQWV